MSIEKVPLGVFYEILIQVPWKYISNLQLTNKNIYHLCNKEDYWKDIVTRRYLGWVELLDKLSSNLSCVTSQTLEILQKPLVDQLKIPISSRWRKYANPDIFYIIDLPPKRRIPDRCNIIRVPIHI